MNITATTNQQNFGIKLFGKDGKEIKNFGTANNYNNTPASRGNFYTTIKVKSMQVRSVGDSFVTSLGFDIDNPLFGKHSLTRKLKMRSNINPLADRQEQMKLLNAFTGIETSNCQELEDQAYSEYIKKRAMATGEKPLSIYDKQLKVLNMTLTQGKQKSHLFGVFSPERMTQFRNMAKSIASEIKLKRV